MSLLFGAYAPPAPHRGLASVTDLERLIGRRLDVVHLFQAWGGGHRALRKQWLDLASGRGRGILISWEPWVPAGPISQPDYTLERILSGAYDAYVREWASELAAYGKTVYLRPMHEMNYPCYPWSQGVGNNLPEAFVAAWRHLRAIFETEGARSVRWVWCPLADDPPGAGFEAFFPGPESVDVLGLDGYNWGGSMPEYGGWRSFREIFLEAYRRVIALDPAPVWIVEVASDTRGGNKARWIEEMLQTLETEMPRVELVSWFHCQKERNWLLGDPPESALALAHGLSPK